MTLKKLNSNSLTLKKLNSNSNSLTLKKLNSNSNSLALQKSNSNSNLSIIRERIQIQNSSSIQPYLVISLIHRYMLVTSLLFELEGREAKRLWRDHVVTLGGTLKQASLTKFLVVGFP